MEMHQIRYFLAVARTLNFTQAADECHVAQPSLSRAIKKLEDELGGELFRRERALTHLTELGRIMLPLLTQAYETATSAKTLATSYRKGGLAPLRIALSLGVDLRLFTRHLSALLEAMPGLELIFFRGAPVDVGEKLRNGDYEIAIAGPFDEAWDRFRSWVLYRSGMSLFMNRSHRLANQPSLELHHLVGERLLIRPYCEAGEQINRLLSDSGVQQTAADKVASDQDIAAMLEANLGVTLMPSSTICADGVQSIRVIGMDIECPVLLHTVIGRPHSPAAAGLIQLLRAANWAEALAAQRTAA